MDNQTALTRVIEKAIKGGWLPYFATFDPNMTKDNIIIRYPEGAASVNFDYEMPGHIVGVGGYSLEPDTIIFDHQFCKALWGTEPHTVTLYMVTAENTPTGQDGSTVTVKPSLLEWQYHLQQLAIAEDRIAYLKDNAGIE